MISTWERLYSWFPTGTQRKKMHWERLMAGVQWQSVRCTWWCWLALDILNAIFACKGFSDLSAIFATYWLRGQPFHFVLRQTINATELSIIYHLLPTSVHLLFIYFSRRWNKGGMNFVSRWKKHWRHSTLF